MSADTPSNEKERPAVSEPNAPIEATPITEPSTDVWRCGLDGRVTIHPTIPPSPEAQVAQDQPEDVLAIRPKRSTYWGDTLRQGEARWKSNGRSAR